MTEIIVPMTKKIFLETRNGEMKIKRKGDTYSLEYHNPIYVNSPFKMPTQFSTDFTIEEIIKSNEVVKFMSRFNL